MLKAKTQDKYVEIEPAPDNFDLEKGVCFFNISGRFVTKTVRDMWKGDMEAHAIGTLVKGMHGMTEEIALQILEGKKILSGWNAKIELLDDDEPMPTFDEIIETKREIWRKEYKSYNELIVALRVRNFGYFAKKNLSEKEMDEFKLYFDDASRIPEFIVEGNTAQEKLEKVDKIIKTIKTINKLLITNAVRIQEWIEEIHENASYLTIHADIETLRNFENEMDRARGKRDDRKAHMVVSEDNIFERLGQQARINMLVASQKMIEDGKATPEMAMEIQERMSRGITGLTQLVSGNLDTKPDEDFKSDTGWLAPSGSYYSCEIIQHIALANELAGVDEHGEQKLENEGWIKVSGGQWQKPEDTKLTKKQLDAIFDWCNKHGMEFRWNGRKMTYQQLLEQEG